MVRDAGDSASGAMTFAGAMLEVLLHARVARAEWNVLMNPLHADAGRIVAGGPGPVQWDERLFR